MVRQFLAVRSLIAMGLAMAIGAWGLRNFSKGRVYMELGEEAAEAALPRLSAALPWLRGPSGE